MLNLQPNSSILCLVHGSTQQPSPHLITENVSVTTWFWGTYTNQHVTPNLATLIDSASYLSNDHLHVGDGKGFTISHIRHTMLHFLKCILKLSNVFHVPYNTKPLLSIQNLYRDNHVYFEFHAYVLYIKDLITKEVLIYGQINDGFYVLSSLLPHQSLKCIGLLQSPRLLICDIVI